MTVIIKEWEVERFRTHLNLGTLIKFTIDCKTDGAFDKSFVKYLILKFFIPHM